MSSSIDNALTLFPPKGSPELESILERIVDDPFDTAPRHAFCDLAREEGFDAWADWCQSQFNAPLKIDRRTFLNALKINEHIHALNKMFLSDILFNKGFACALYTTYQEICEPTGSMLDIFRRNPITSVYIKDKLLPTNGHWWFTAAICPFTDHYSGALGYAFLHEIDTIDPYIAKILTSMRQEPSYAKLALGRACVNFMRHRVGKPMIEGTLLDFRGLQ